MRKFTVPCNFNGVQAPVAIYIGEPKSDHHPIHFQADWLSKERGGTVPQEIMDSLADLKKLAEENGVSFEELCVYALEAAAAENNAAEAAASASNEGEQEMDVAETEAEEPVVKKSKKKTSKKKKNED